MQNLSESEERLLTLLARAFLGRDSSKHFTSREIREELEGNPETSEEFKVWAATHSLIGSLQGLKRKSTARVGYEQAREGRWIIKPPALCAPSGEGDFHD